MVEQSAYTGSVLGSSPRVRTMNFDQKKTKLENKKISEKEFLSYKKALEIADELLEKHKSQMKDNLQKDIDGWYGGDQNALGGWQKSLDHYIQKTPKEILSHYQGHGVTKGGYRDRVAALLSVAQNKSIKGDAALLVGGPGVYIPAYTDTEILVLSTKDSNMQIRKQKENGMSEPVFNSDRSWKAENIGAIVIDVHYYPLFEEFKKMFPTMNFIKASELSKYFEI